MSKLKEHIFTSRYNYSKSELTETTISSSPFHQFEMWLQEAIENKIHEPYAMLLSTVSRVGRPSARVVLLRSFDEKGFVFYTNYNSQKGKELSENSYATITFFWHELERQIRIDGIIKKTDTAVSDNYFESRPKESKIGAWVSQQSEVIGSRDVLDLKYKELELKYKDVDKIPRPSFWGGLCLMPDKIEFWQGRPNRLHDRILYHLTDDGDWEIKRLAP